MSIKNGLKQIENVFQKGNFQEEVEFETSMLALAFLSEIEKLADAKGIKRNELAEIVGTSASYITQILRGNKIPNLKILTAMGLALDKKFNVSAVENMQIARKNFNDLIIGNTYNSKNSLRVSHKKENMFLKKKTTDNKSYRCLANG